MIFSHRVEPKGIPWDRTRHGFGRRCEFQCLCIELERRHVQLRR
jgi:hypothetical protein